MAETVVVNIKCYHCKSLITLEKPAHKERGKMKCPTCKGRLNILFDINSDPQKYNFLLDPDEAVSASEGNDGGSSSASDPEKAAGAKKNGSSPDGGDPEQDERDAVTSKHKTVYKEFHEDFRRDSGRRTPVGAYDDDDDDDDEFDREERRRPRNKKKSSSSKRDKRVHSEPFPFRVFLLRKKMLGLVREEYDLNPGSNIIGRDDPNEQSEVAITDDDFISRRSVRLDAVSDGYDVDCTLTVLNASNPVKVNGRTIDRGDNCEIRFGDTITMGHSKFKLDHD